MALQMGISTVDSSAGDRGSSLDARWHGNWIWSKPNRINQSKHLDDHGAG
jgi:hypothetical protein